MYEIKANIHKNRLYVVLKGSLSTEEAKKAADEVVTATAQLKPGFDIITDISEFVPTSPEASEHIKRAQVAAFQHGAKKVARVVKDVISSMQFKRTQKEAGVGYEVVTVSTFEEAERILDQE